MQKSIDCKNMCVLANSRKAPCLSNLNVQKKFKYLKMMYWCMQAHGHSSLRKVTSRAHHCIVRVKIVQVRTSSSHHHIITGNYNYKC
jgi:hypothetical protein